MVSYKRLISLGYHKGLVEEFVDYFGSQSVDFSLKKVAHLRSWPLVKKLTFRHAYPTRLSIECLRAKYPAERARVYIHENVNTLADFRALVKFAKEMQA